jgi:hypothetical protein
LLRSSVFPFTTTSKKGKDKDIPLPDAVEKVQEEQSMEMERRMAALKKFGLPKKLEEGGGGVSEGMYVYSHERESRVCVCVYLCVCVGGWIYTLVKWHDKLKKKSAAPSCVTHPLTHTHTYTYTPTHPQASPLPRRSARTGNLSPTMTRYGRTTSGTYFLCVMPTHTLPTCKFLHTHTHTYTRARTHTGTWTIKRPRAGSPEGEKHRHRCDACIL